MAFDLSTKKGRFIAYLNALFVEHSIFNLFWKNFHQIDEGVYRSAQMNPATLTKTIDTYKLKTIISLRKNSPKSPLYLFEKEICEEKNVRFLHVSLRSRKIPTPEKLLELKSLFESVEKPFLIHCKAGADRTSLAAILYLYFKGVDLQSAMDKQLGFLTYGHIKQSKAGIIEHYFESFLASGEEDLIEWTATHKEEVEKSFKPQGFFSFINDKVLRRE